MIGELITYVSENYRIVVEEMGVHLFLSSVSLGIAMVFGIGFGIISYYYSGFKQFTYFIANTLRVIPSIALLTLMLPIVGTGKGPALIALTILAFPPIFIHTHVG